MRFFTLFCVVSLMACDDPGADAVEAPQLEEKIRDGVVTDERPEVGRISGCTATLVAADAVITAAHCVGYRSATRVGRYDTFRVESGGRTHQYTVNRYRSFSRSLGQNDIALMGLAEMVPPEVATPAPMARETPEGGTSLTVYGYGCTRIGGSGDGRKRRATYAQGDRAQHLCPGDSGGPVFNDETGAITRINSGYQIDRGYTDIYGLVPGLYDELMDQLREWTQGEIPEEGEPLDPSIPVCGRNVDVREKWTCNPTRTHRYRCIPGDSPTWEECTSGCVSNAVGKADTCAAAGAQDTCGDLYRPFTEWVCATDDLTLVRCHQGHVETRRCDRGCAPTAGTPAACLD